MKRSSQLLELASKRSTEISELDFNKEKLITSLENVAHHLAKNRTEVTLIVVGGGLSTILLKTRASTHDVDFFWNPIHFAREIAFTGNTNTLRRLKIRFESES